MNGPDHYDLAEQLLEHAASMLDTDVAVADIHLSGANLTGAKVPHDAPVPGGWVRDPDSRRLKRADKESESAT